ncbi:MAG TPA: uroporphyrinogen decarboxylase family protein [Prolixibacteraceae bacterium]|nr:uroporphyrinogen decarboxylase [Bacteroidales bacterium]HPJ77216.1 uroporphyrinogen decarboxylase family protein [Prolixibacteraceae bacterium]HRV87721.1 uroporphyrinogen decarboxylase family protein [Prolixibacteraceae bacterium]
MMNGLELIRAAMGLQETERVPWVPFVGVHGGFLTGVDATRYLQSSALMTAGISKAIDMYQPDGIPVVFDLQLEAEVLGCALKWSSGTPPAVISHPLAEGRTLGDLPEFTSGKGRIPQVLETTRALREKYPGIALYGLVTGPFTLALHLLGTDIFLKLFEAPGEVHDLMSFCTEVAGRMAGWLMEAGCDVIALVDPMTSQIDPDSFEEYVAPYATRIFSDIRAAGRLSSFFVCGHAQQNIEVMCRCRPDNISIDENIPLDFVREKALASGVSFGGNLRLTVVLLMGSADDARQEALTCLDQAGRKGFILAPGCDLPMETPVENLQAVAELVRDPYQQEVVRALETSDGRIAILNMNDYGQSDKVIVDIITLDSESCAPCQYMVEAVKRVAPHFEGVVEWREHAIKRMEAVTFMSSLMVKNIPTICIDGKIAFVSKIPPQGQLIQAIQQRINEKLKLKIRSKRSEILLFGETEEVCREMNEKVRQASLELGKDISITMITDRAKMAAFGITRGPALVTVHYRLKCENSQPSLDVLKEWIKEL